MIKKILDYFGYALVKKTYYPECYDMSSETEAEFSIIDYAVSGYTLTSRERRFALYKSIQYVVNNQLPGDIVECGVWKGGSMMLTAKTLISLGDTGRKLYLYDTFSGMSQPGANDFDYGGKSAAQGLKDLNIQNYGDWCYSSLDEVRKNLYSTGYPRENIIFVQGKVEDTIPSTLPERISILRLDTDWYESTAHELLHLFPKLISSGVIIIDDYGHWKGARQAVDEYITLNKLKLLLHRVDFTARIGVKI